MASQRPSRTNFSGIGSHNDNGGPLSDDAPSAPTVRATAPADAVRGEEHPDRPAWQDYFFLGPNVRFTRTPDREMRDQRGDDNNRQPAPPPGQSETATRDSAPSPAVPVPSASESRNPPPRTEPAMAAHHPEAKAPVSPVTASAPRGNAEQQPVPETMRELPNRPGTPWSHLSDHVFFEFVGLPRENVALPPLPATAATKATPPAVVARVPATQALKAASQTGHAVLRDSGLTALYRTIECDPSPKRAATGSDIGNESPAADPAPAPVVPEPGPSHLSAPAAPTEASGTEEKPVPPAEPSASSRTVDISRPVLRSPSLPLAGKVAHVKSGDDYEFPSNALLQQPPEGQGFYMSQERLEQNADLLESVLEDFGVKGEIIHVRPGPVVTLYEFEPAPGVKSSRVINLSEDIARSMSAISARVAVVPGRNVIGIELPNETRETVFLRELIESDGFRKTTCKLALGLGKTIGGEPVIAELAKMPHLLVAGTTGSGKSVAINTMILSLLYRLKPEECRLIMIDPKMLELSVYDGIPHLLTPVVTDPKKAVTALKWAVREMEDRYRKMAGLGVRNIDGYNQRAVVARDKGESVVIQVQTGFDKGTGEPIYEEQEIDLTPMPYIVVIVDEMADLMMVAGKEIEGAIQRLAQMARAAGIHLIMATQRPSVDVITGTIKANFPTRISFQVTSKIDSRTILGEQGAEQLLGQGDMLHMAGGGRIVRVHGPFVSDKEIEHVVTHLKLQGQPKYLETVTVDQEDEDQSPDEMPSADSETMDGDDGDTLYQEAIKVVMRDKKCSTSYIQRRLGIGYNRAASLVERMENDGLVGAPSHVGKREILMTRS